MRVLPEIVGTYLRGLKTTTCIREIHVGFQHSIGVFSCHLNDETRQREPELYLVWINANDDFEYFAVDTLTEVFNLLTKKTKQLKAKYDAKKQ